MGDCSLWGCKELDRTQRVFTLETFEGKKEKDDKEENELQRE